MMDIEFIFGERTWDDLRGEVLARVRTRYHQMPVAAVEDAVSAAVVDLLDYWVWLPKSIVEDDPDLTFRGALVRANHKASEHLLADLSRPDRSTFTDLQAELDDGGDGDFNDYLDSVMVDHTAIDPAEEVEENDLKRRARQLLEDLSDEDKVRWADAYLAGETERVTAEREGVNQSTVHRRRREGIARLRDRAHEYGIA